MSRETLGHVIAGGEPCLRTFRALVRYLAIPADDVLEMLDTPDDGEPWHADKARGGRARQGSLCADCGEALSRAAAAARWAVDDPRQMLIPGVPAPPPQASPSVEGVASSG